MENQALNQAEAFIDEKPFDYLYWQIMGKSESWRSEIEPYVLDYYRAFKNASTFEDYLEQIAPPEESMIRMWWSMADFEEQEEYISEFTRLKQVYA